MATLNELRLAIDEIDAEIVQLLERRAEVVLAVKELKTRDCLDVYSPARERQVLSRVAELGAAGNFPRESLQKVFGAIVSGTRSLIGETSVSYVGPEFSFAYEGAIKHFGGDVRLLPAAAVREVFSKVGSGEISYGVVPIETTSHGLETATLEAFLTAGVRVISEVLLREELTLSSLDESSLTAVGHVFADAPTLARAEPWLRVNLPGAAREVVDNSALAAQKTARGSAAVVSPLVAERFGLSVLASGIEGESGIHSRFFVLGQTLPPRTGRDKTTLVVVARDRAGALRDLLTPFADRGITLTKIESKPRQGAAWEYLFMIDVLGHLSDPPLQEALALVEAQSSFYKLLGSYPAE